MAASARPRHSRPVRWPQAARFVRRCSLQEAPLGQRRRERRSTGSGTLLLHGVKHAVAGTVEIHREGEGRRVRADFPLILTDFAITPPEYLGVGVGSKLLVKVSLIAMPVRPPAR